jgi:hypothetical protein
MSAPIQSGDLCQVIAGALGARSMNKGREVIVMHRNGEELIIQTLEGTESLGLVWRCRSKDGLPFVRHDPTAFRDVPANQADFAAAWLRKLDADPTSNMTKVDEEISA